MRRHVLAGIITIGLIASSADAAMLADPTYGCGNAELFARAWTAAQVGGAQERMTRLKIEIENQNCVLLPPGPVDVISHARYLGDYTYRQIHYLQRPHRGERLRISWGSLRG